MPLNTEGMQMPIANKRAAQQVDSANQIGLQQQLKAAGQTPVTSADIQGLAAQETAKETQVAQGQQAADTQRTVQTAQRDFQQQQISQQQQNIQDRAALDKRRIDAENQLAALGRDVKAQLLDKELALDSRTGQLKLTNERQLADLAVKTAQDQEDLNLRLRDMQRASDARLQAARFAADEVARIQEFASQDRMMSADEDLQQQLAEYSRRADELAKQAKRDAAKTGKIIGATKFIAGAAITYFSGGTATAAGAPLMASGASDIAGNRE